jgi:hypothetical protein
MRAIDPRAVPELRHLADVHRACSDEEDHVANPHGRRSATAATGQPDADMAWLARVDQFFAARSSQRPVNVASAAATGTPSCSGNRS